WADGASLRLLEFVSASLRRAPALLVVATRPDVRDDVAATIAALVRRGAARIELAPFGPDDVRAYLDSAGVDSAVAPRVFGATGGTPLFVREFARHLAAGKPFDAVSESLAELVRGDAARLTSDARALLELSACFEGEIPADIAGAAAGAGSAFAGELIQEGFL